MKESIFHKILIYLYRNDAINENQIDITEFLKTIWDKGNTGEQWNNLNRIKYAIDRIQSDGYGHFENSPGYLSLNEEKFREDMSTKYTVVLGYDLNKGEVAIKARITTKGYDYIRLYIRDNEQHASVLKTNDSVLRLNNDVLPKTFRSQDRIGAISLVIAGITAIFIILTVYLSEHGVISEELKNTNKVMSSQSQSLESLKQSVQNLDSALSKAVKDSLYQKRGSR